MNYNLHVRKSTPTEAVMCEVGQIDLCIFWHKLLLRFVGRAVDLPGNRLVKKALCKPSSPAHFGFKSVQLVT